MEGGVGQPGFFHKPRLPQYNIKPSFYKNHHQYNRQNQYQDQVTNATNFDGKRMRKTMTRRTVDYNASVVKLVENRVWQRDQRDVRPLQPDGLYTHELVSPCELIKNPVNAVATKFVRTATNKIRCPIFCVVWTPEGRRLVTGASSGEFTLWNGMTFNFETILQAHDYPVRSMVWSHNNLWLMSGDHMGYVKYWQSNMNNVRMFQAHVDQAIREITFSPTDAKFATCSDDGSVRVFDFFRCHEERILRGHGADVKCLDWHPQKSIIVSGSKDSQQPVKLWDAKSGLSLATIHAHKSTVMSARWNKNGNWLLTASRDHLVKVFDLRAMKELSICRGHKKEATCVAWHPHFEDIFASGGSDGSLLYWQVGHEKEIGGIEQAHDSIVWSLAWHPLGHILCSGSNDHSTKFWTRNRPGDKMRDKYNLNTLPQGMFDDSEYDDETTSLPIIPGMGLEQVKDNQEEDNAAAAIPGLDSSAEELAQLKPTPQRKVPYAKPIPMDFQKKWEAQKAPGIAPKEVQEKEAQSGKQSGQNAPMLSPLSKTKSIHKPQGGPPKTGLLGTHPGSVPSNEGSKEGHIPPLFDALPAHDAGPTGGDVDMRHRFSDVDMRHVGGSSVEARLDGRDAMHREESFREGPPREGQFRDRPPRDLLHRDGSSIEGPPHDFPSRGRGGPPWDGPPRDDPHRPSHERDIRPLFPGGLDKQFHDEDLRFSGARDFDGRDFKPPAQDEDLRGARPPPFRDLDQSNDRRHDGPRDMDLRHDSFDNDDRRNFMHNRMNPDDEDLRQRRPRDDDRLGGPRSGVDEQELMHDQRFMDRRFPQDQDGPRGTKRGFDGDRDRGPGMGRGFSRGGGYRGGNRGGRGGSRGGGQWRNDRGRGNFRGGFRGRGRGR
ncbi:pre-mRNA 3' end processing protein WDR33-like [Antedon mediterranea]|uniref:pre-mRNA 3' end processing protein WDR33-like n=1 Tax=Antedon mediterranea TaxID=105859 RepID=UPI003AF5B8B4